MSRKISRFFLIVLISSPQGVPFGMVLSVSRQKVHYYYFRKLNKTLLFVGQKVTKSPGEFKLAMVHSVNKYMQLEQ